MINLFLLGKKGLEALTGLSFDHRRLISKIIIGTDKQVINDYSSELIRYCLDNDIKYVVSNISYELSKDSKYNIAIGWRWIIRNTQKLTIVFHDSLLPKLRGFNPLVTALINGDREIGVTALKGIENFDKGEIFKQKSINIDYPIKIANAIDKISFLYKELLKEVIDLIIEDKLIGKAQNDLVASYSLWRDNEDYFINWNHSSESILQFINAVGYPYKGACTNLGGEVLRIYDAQIYEDVRIENRDPGKVLFKDSDGYIIVCGKGLLKISEFFIDNNTLKSLSHFRSRFK